MCVVGAGISGIGAGWHLRQQCPDRTFTILEARDDLGGTWDLFRYPGVRSDSDMHTLGFSFKPWVHEKRIADGPSILEYLHETVAEADLRPKIRFGHRVRSAEWSSADAAWTLDVDTAEGPTSLTCRFLFMCSGYYSYRGGYTPDFAGREDFGGTIVHPQEWPADLDHSGQRVVVIGSGATAVTIVPAMAHTAAHVTMLQRTPTWIVSQTDIDPVGNRVQRMLGPLGYRLIRERNIWRDQLVYRQTRQKPERVAAELLRRAAAELGEGFDLDRDFTPPYDPWDQRLCLIPNGDLFESLRTQRCSIVTDTIERFTETGIQLDSGVHLEADIIVTATGLQLVTLGEVDFHIDGEPVDFSRTWTYKGLGYSGVPNLVSSFGYINASWTLRSDLTCGFVCRVLNHLRDTGTEVVTPTLRPGDESMERRDWIEDFSAGYMQRMMSALPMQGDREPWINPQNYRRDRRLIAKQPLDDGVLVFR